MPAFPRTRTLIFDLGGVLVSWVYSRTSSIPPRQIHAIYDSSIWQAFECGKITQEECYKSVASQFQIDAMELERAFSDARATLQFNHPLLTLIRDLQAEAGGRLQIVIMSNISAPDWDFVRSRGVEWINFSNVFTSAAAGMRKPSLQFFRHVIDEIGADPATTVVIDDKPENVLSARTLGMNAIQYGADVDVQRLLLNYVGNPIQRGRAFLAARAGKHETETETGVTIAENFSQLLILEATQDASLMNCPSRPRRWNFFREKPVLTTNVYPDDTDTTAMAHTVLKSDSSVLQQVMDEMLTYQDDDGVILSYYDTERKRVDPTVCASVLRLFYMHGRSSDVANTLEYVHNVLRNRAYLAGTRYYGPDVFPWYIARLLDATPNDTTLQDLLRPLLRERLQERMAADGDALALAMRCLACSSVGLVNIVDLRTLALMQQEDGGWPAGWFYRFGVSGIKAGNRGLTTALAVQALASVDEC